VVLFKDSLSTAFCNKSLILYSAAAMYQIVGGLHQIMDKICAALSINVGDL